ncbi:hypothetical protein ACWEV3_07450 [Saccharopolyspora sp. NPDC003752]
MASRSTLMIIERAYRGSVESQFADVLYFVRELHRQSGGVDIELRGPAAGFAVDTEFEPAIRIAGRVLDSLPDPRHSLRQLLDDGVGVRVEEPDLAALGPSARDRLVPGVHVVPANEPASRWPDYERVWFF